MGWSSVNVDVIPNVLGQPMLGLPFVGPMMCGVDLLSLNLAVVWFDWIKLRNIFKI
jgi:hypothetical protein